MRLDPNVFPPAPVPSPNAPVPVVLLPNAELNPVGWELRPPNALPTPVGWLPSLDDSNEKEGRELPVPALFSGLVAPNGDVELDPGCPVGFEGRLFNKSAPNDDVGLNGLIALPPNPVGWGASEGAVENDEPVG